MSDAIQNTGSTPSNAAASLTSRFARKPAANTIDKASQDFEGMFMAQMLQPMFETVGVDPVFGGGHGEEVMRGFLIQEYGKAMAKNSHFGIANAVRNELIVAQQKQHENQQTSNAGSAASTYGATNAAGSISKKAGIPVPHPAVALIAIMNDMVELMAAEPDLVIGRKLGEHGKLLKRKQKMALEYRTIIKAISAKPEILKEIPEDTRRKLKISAQKLAEQADQNGRMLRTAVTATQRLMQNIIAFIKSEVLPHNSYKNHKTAHLELGTYSPTCVPVAVRRSV